MSNEILILVVAAITYLSRAVAVALLPSASGALLEYIRRLPAPLFVGLAVYAMVGDEVGLPGSSTLAAGIAAVVVTPRRSLGLCLAAGLAAYIGMELLL